MQQNESSGTPNVPDTAVASEPVITAQTQSSNPLWKDLSVPISIVIAGMFIGAGLYFGNLQGGAAAPVNPMVAQGGQQEQEDTTNLVDPVTEDDHLRGNPDAPVVIVEYSDYDCPFCSRFHDTMKVVVEKYGDNVAWVYRQFPIEQLHPQAPAVAVASECVARIGGNDAFWQFSDAYFAARGAGDQTAHDVLIPQLVVEAGVSESEFTNCFESGDVIPDIQADMQDAVETGGGGTPWSILIAPDGTTYPINGALPQGAIEQLIESALEQA